MKIVINKCFGGFSVSLEAAQFMAESGDASAKEQVEKWEQRDSWVQAYLKTGKWSEEAAASRSMLEIDARYHRQARFHGFDFERDNPYLVAAVETLGDKANGEYAKLRVVEVPDGIQWEIDEYDGMEKIAESHRSWS